MNEAIGKTYLGEPLYACVRCGKETLASRIPCVNCWEVEHRLDEYLTSPKGRALVSEKLAALQPDPVGDMEHLAEFCRSQYGAPGFFYPIEVGSSPDGIAAALQLYCESE